MKNTVIITGGSGFIGTRLTCQLQEQFHVIDFSRRSGRDVLDPKAWSGLENISAIVHLASMTNVPRSWQHPTDYLEKNLRLMLPVLEFARKSQIRVLNISTYLYGSPQSLPVSESHPTSPTNPYALSKKMAEDIGIFYSENYSMPLVLVRPFNIYGPGMDPSYLMPTLIKQIREKTCIEVQDVRPRRDYLHVDDCARALALLVKMPEPPRVVNLCSGISYSIAEIIGHLREITGRDLVLKDLQRPRTGDPLDTRGSSILLQQKMWSPHISIHEGLKEMWEKNV